MRPESLRSTMRTLPNAPLPTTRNRRKWLRLTKDPSAAVIKSGQRLSWPTFVGQDNGLALRVAHLVSRDRNVDAERTGVNAVQVSAWTGAGGCKSTILVLVRCGETDKRER